MSTFNISQKINGGGSFNVSRNTSGSTTVLTTTANQYAKVTMRGSITCLNGGIASMLIGANIVRTLGNGSGTPITRYIGGIAEDPIITLLVPPNSSLSIASNGLFGVSATVEVSGSYVLIENTL